MRECDRRIMVDAERYCGSRADENQREGANELSCQGAQQTVRSLFHSQNLNRCLMWRQLDSLVVRSVLIAAQSLEHELSFRDQ